MEEVSNELVEAVEDVIQQREVNSPTLMAQWPLILLLPCGARARSCSILKWPVAHGAQARRRVAVDIRVAMDKLVVFI